MLNGIVPIVFVPFDTAGQIDEAGLRRVVRFELEGGADGIGINGFASESYKLTDPERLRTAQIVASENANQVPLVIGIAAGSTEAALAQMADFKTLNPSAFMVLPPATMNYAANDLVKHYVTLADSSDTPIMVQHSPHIAQYSHLELTMEHLAEMAQRSNGIQYFKIEGPGAPERMRQLKSLIPDSVQLFGGVGGLSFIDELDVGVAGVIPGVGFNEVFKQAWGAWQAGDRAGVREVLMRHQALIQVVSGKGHEFSLHVRKQLAQRAGLIACSHVRCPTLAPSAAEIAEVFRVADLFELRISRRI